MGKRIGGVFGIFLQCAPAVAQISVSKFVRNDIIRKIKRRSTERGFPCDHAAAIVTHARRRHMQVRIRRIIDIVHRHAKALIMQ